MALYTEEGPITSSVTSGPLQLLALPRPGLMALKVLSSWCYFSRVLWCVCLCGYAHQSPVGVITTAPVAYVGGLWVVCEAPAAHVGLGTVTGSHSTAIR